MLGPRRFLRRVSTLGIAGAILAPSVAMAATESISVINNQFVNGTRTIALGDTVEWTNDSSPGRNHTTTGAAPLTLWNELLTPDETFPLQFEQGGGFGYRCTIHPSMTGAIKVRPEVSPTSGDLDTIFTIRVANVDPDAGFQYVIQRRRNSGDWRAWRTITTQTTTFDPAKTGTWSFRSKLERISDGASTGFSPKRSVTVGG